MIQTKNPISAPKPHASYVFLILLWGISAVALSLPIISQLPWLQKAAFLFLPAFFTLFGTLARPQESFAFWAFILTFLVSQTGFQAQIGEVTTSALEIIAVLLLLILAVSSKFHPELVKAEDVPGHKWLFTFIGWASLIFAVGLVRGDSLSNAVLEYKGFVLYPLMIYLIVVGVRSESLLRWMVLYAALWYAWISIQALRDYLNHESVFAQGMVYRASGEYAPVNIFGSTAVAIALLLIGITMKRAATHGRGWQWFSWFLGGLLLLGAFTSSSRGALVALVVGSFVLTILSRKRILQVVLGFSIIILVIWYFLPGTTLQGNVNHLFQFSDSSTLKRASYINSGLHALQVYWPAGAGWGNGFWYYAGAGLAPSGFVPWYHNDYLNLAVQVGLPGLVLYIGFWFPLLQAGFRVWRQYSDSVAAVYLAGSLAALCALLTGAMFDHLLWRSDMGGLVGWTAGILVASMHLAKRPALSEEAIGA